MDYSLPYSADSSLTTIRYSAEDSRGIAEGFSSGICIVSEDILSSGVDTSEAGAAGLFDIKNKQTLYAKAVHEKLSPASLTKIMTVLVALENGSPDQTITATDTVKNLEKGAATAGIKAGDTMTLDQALHMLMVSSSNDVALMVAESIGGTVDHFVEMMNERAKQLGATNTHFMNPHGLTDPDHYTTAYDMYLIFNTAIKYESFSQIISMNSYQTTYYDKNGKPLQFNATSSNKYFKGQYEIPENITVLGGKSGSTNAAGQCLILQAKDIRGNSYIAVVMKCTDVDTLYATMTDLLDEIDK